MFYKTQLSWGSFCWTPTSFFQPKPNPITSIIQIRSFAFLHECTDHSSDCWRKRLSNRSSPADWHLNGTVFGDEEVFRLQVSMTNHIHVDVGHSTPWWKLHWKKMLKWSLKTFQVASLVSTLLIILGVKWKPCDFVKLQTWSAWRAGLQCVHWRCQPGESQKVCVRYGTVL